MPKADIEWAAIEIPAVIDHSTVLYASDPRIGIRGCYFMLQTVFLTEARYFVEERLVSIHIQYSLDQFAGFTSSDILRSTRGQEAEIKRQGNLGRDHYDAHCRPTRRPLYFAGEWR